MPKIYRSISPGHLPTNIHPLTFTKLTLSLILRVDPQRCEHLL